MSRWVAFLRGMNLGRRRITNAELCACFERMGLSEVSAFLASGNVLFDAPEPDASRLAEHIETGLAKALDYAVPTFLRSAVEVQAIAAARPFSDDELAGRGKPQVMLLQSEPAASERRRVLGLASADDLLVSRGRELYWLPRAGILDSQLDLKLIERSVGPSTMRTLNTLARLAKKLG